MSLTGSFRLVVEQYDEGRRDDYYNAHVEFIKKIKQISAMLGLPDPRPGNDAMFSPDDLSHPGEDRYAFRLQAYLVLNIKAKELSKFLSIAIFLNESLLELTAWVEPMP